MLKPIRQADDGSELIAKEIQQGSSRVEVIGFCSCDEDEDLLFEKVLEF